MVCLFLHPSKIKTMEGLILLLPIVIFIGLRFLPKGSNDSSKIVKLSKLVSYLSILVSILSALLLYKMTAFSVEMATFKGLGFSLRLDFLSILMFTMVSIIGLIVLRFSDHYLDGDVNKAGFFKKISFTLGSVLLMVVSGNLLSLWLSWVFTSVGLNELIIFYKNREKAIIAAKKKFVIARVGDFFLALSFGLIYATFGTGSLQDIFDKVSNQEFVKTPILELALLFLAISAALKSVQIPFHSWLLNVMETPTPVSALLHAGLLNAGPFLVIRFAHLFNEVTFGNYFLVAIAGLTAIYGSLVHSSQPAVKVALAYSSIGHMGFSLFLAGMGAYHAALLHFVSHSFYKAYAFLTTGSEIEKQTNLGTSYFQREGNIYRIIISVVLIAGLYTVLNYSLKDFFNENFQMKAISIVIFLGISNLMINSIDSRNTKTTIFLLLIMAFMVLVSFIVFESILHFGLRNQIPLLNELDTLLKGMVIFYVGLYALVIFLQWLSPYIKGGKAYHFLFVYARNGFYFNIFLTRLLQNIILLKRPKTKNI
jgi:NAD(P)H-quinone oxidoreductase subunit 5